jgi:hypothetical protein
MVLAKDHWTQKTVFIQRPQENVVRSRRKGMPSSSLYDTSNTTRSSTTGKDEWTITAAPETETLYSHEHCGDDADQDQPIQYPKEGTIASSVAFGRAVALFGDSPAVPSTHDEADTTPMDFQPSRMETAPPGNDSSAPRQVEHAKISTTICNPKP